MRQIKFRGKRADNGEWVYGYYVLEHEDINTIHVFDRGSTIIRLVLPHTVGQYTGLKDKNGTEIYEGDIVDHYWHGGFYVSFERGCFSLHKKGKSGTKISAFEVGSLEIIGNIHE